MYSIIEKTSISKRADGLECEDGLFVSDDFIAVVDGVTPKGKSLWDGHTSGYYAKSLVMEGLKKLPANADAREAITMLNESVAAGYTPERLETAKKDIKEQLRACVIIFSVARSQVWSFGDCQCIVNGEVHTHEKTFDRILSDMRSLYLEMEKLCGKTEAELEEHDTGRDFIMPVLQKESLLANSPTVYGYDNLNGFDLCLDRIRIYDVKKGEEVVLASDGFPSLCPTLKQSEEILKQTLENDPLCYKTYISTKGRKPGNKSFDDRTYIRFTV